MAGEQRRNIHGTAICSVAPSERQHAPSQLCRGTTRTLVSCQAYCLLMTRKDFAETSVRIYELLNKHANEMVGTFFNLSNLGVFFFQVAF